MRRLIFSVLVLALVAAACGSDEGSSPFPDGAFALSASSNLAVGNERMLIGIAGQDGERLASPDIPVTITVRPESGGEAQTLPGTFMWAVPDHSGLYRVNVEFPTAGTWVVSVVPDGAPALPDFHVTVHAESITPGIGQEAPRSVTATLDDGPLEEISTDDHPDPRLYEITVAEAVTSGRPSIIVFATPRFCTTGVCGPTLDDVKAMMPAHPGVNFLHVEVFTNLDDPENLEVVPAIYEWGLPTEPWVFVVDADGIVIGRFEGLVGQDELEELLQ